MFRITIRGQEPVFIEGERGEELFKKWINDELLPAKIAVGNTAFYTSDIRSIHKLGKTNSELAPKHDHLEREYETFRNKMLSLPIERRSQLMRIPNMIWQAHTAYPMPEETKAEIKARQLAYFQEHPNCIYANPKCYRDLIPEMVYSRDIEGLQPSRNLMPAAVMRLITNIIQNDLRFSA